VRDRRGKRRPPARQELDDLGPSALRHAAFFVVPDHRRQETPEVVVGGEDFGLLRGQARQALFPSAGRIGIRLRMCEGMVKELEDA
jgi:hypothetical protein